MPQSCQDIPTNEYLSKNNQNIVYYLSLSLYINKRIYPVGLSDVLRILSSGQSVLGLVG